jgi:hypothetical protein
MIDGASTDSKIYLLLCSGSEGTNSEICYADAE